MTDERRDDEILGRALSRAIETIDVNQTPYERSRIAATPARRSIFGLWQIVTAAAAIVLAVAIGSWLARPTEGQPGIAASPTATPSASAPTTTATSTATPAPTVTPTPTRPDHQIVYFARDGQPPISQHFDGGGVPTTPDQRIFQRVSTLLHSTQVPPNAFTAVPPQTSIGANTVRISGDLATVDFSVTGGDWGVRGSAQTLALTQQLVYTVTEEPGIRRVLITQNGGAPATIDQLVVTKLLTREDVFGYSFVAGLGQNNGISSGGDDSIAHVGARLVSATTDGSRVVVKLEGRGPNGQVADLPSFSAWLEQSDDLAVTNGKYGLYVQLQWNGGGNSNGAAGLTVYDQTPLRVVTTNGNNVFRIELDDARPWRAYMPSASQLVIEIGGD
ncbi:MAG TPA: GerMN domain-containing protein, partial [Candidatus Limnocylindria bacterium]